MALQGAAAGGAGDMGAFGTPTILTAIELAAMLTATDAMMAVNRTLSMALAASAADASTKLNSPI